MRFPAESEYPKQIFFSKEAYQIKFVNNLDCFGITDAVKKEIRIKKGMARRQIFLTLIHELLHVIEFEHPVKIKHKTIYKLEKAIFEMLVDNFI